MSFQKLGYDGITTITGNFDHTLEELCSQQDKIDLVYIDGNHRYEPTLRYFRQLLTRITPESVLIFDDIHWSPEMEAAWEEIRLDGSVRRP